MNTIATSRTVFLEGTQLAPQDSGVRPGVVFALCVFLLLWFVGLDQYLFVPFLSLYILARERWPRLVAPPAWLWVPMMLIGALGALAVLWSDRPGDCIRTANVWFSGLLLAWAVASVSLRGLRVIAGTLLGIWLSSLAIYAVSVSFPSIADHVLAAKHPGTLATSTTFSTPTLIFHLNVARPVGFALYANELACFGVAAVAAYLLVRSSRRTLPMVILEVLALIGLVLSTSRSLILCAMALLLGVLLLRPAAASRHRSRLVPLSVTLLLAVAVAAMLVDRGLVAEGLGGAESLSSARYGGTQELRSLSYSLGWEYFEQNKWSGIGGMPWLGAVQIGSLSLPISLAVRHGIPGLAAGVYMMLRSAIVAVPSLVAPSWAKALVAGTILMFFVSCVTVQFDDDALSFAGFVLCVTLLARGRADRKGAA